jgi:hypothetical protein
LDRDTGPTAGDRAFLRDRLGVSLGGDLNDSSETYQVQPRSSGLLAGLPGGRFDDGQGGVYHVRFPDVLVPAAAGAAVALDYVGGRGGAAAVNFANPLNGSRVVVFGFPFETLLEETSRQGYLARVLEFFEALPAPEILEVVRQAGDGAVRLTWSSVSGQRYRVETKTSLSDLTWQPFSGPTEANGSSMSVVDPEAGLVSSRFYRVVRE